jgi:hypothetical protein
MTGLLSSNPSLADPGEGGGRMRVWVETVETGAADSITSTYHMARLPSNARIMGTSKVTHDALGSTTTKLHVGVYNPSGRNVITNDADALNTAIVMSTSGSKQLVGDPANIGKRLWEFVNGQTTDPKGMLDIKIALYDAHLSSGAGTVTTEIVYSLD